MSRDLAIDANVVAHLRELKLPGIARAYRELARQSRDQGWTPEEYLLEVLDAELRSRTENVAKQRLVEARFPSRKTIDQFDFGAQPALDREQIMRLSRCEWVTSKQPVLLAGPVGTGKTHLAIALGIEAAQRRFRVRFFRVDDLVRTLTEARSQHEVSRLTKRLDNVDVLILDELGFVPFDRTGAELLFNLLANRYQRRATVVTTNLAFSEWSRVFGDEKLTAALLDRIAENAQVVLTGGPSFRTRRPAPNATAGG
jgi:DNA replication protein DnaC